MESTFIVRNTERGDSTESAYTVFSICILIDKAEQQSKHTLECPWVSLVRVYSDCQNA